MIVQDKTDLRILDVLQENGRITNTELAKKVGLSAPPAVDRIKKLEKRGAIRKYVALVDNNSIGIETVTFVQTTLNGHGKASVLEFIEAVTSIPEVLECHHVTGDADFLLKIAVKNIQAYEELVLENLTALPHIQSLKTMVVLSTPKFETGYSINVKESEHEK